MILRATAQMGAASAVNVLAGLLRMKLIAVLLGPAGVGLAGLLINLIQTGAALASLGLGSAGTRAIAEANGQNDAEAVERSRRALVWGVLILACLGALGFWLASAWIARLAFGDSARAAEVVWLAPGVGLAVAAGSQAALLTGLRRIGALAKITAASGVVSALFGVAAVWVLGADGVIVMVLIAPITSFVLGHLAVARLPRKNVRLTGADLAAEWRSLLRLGIAFMLSGLVLTGGHLILRSLVQRDLGADALGHFQAAWTLSLTCMGLVIGAMGSDYYPRLTAALRDRHHAQRLVTQQTEVALLICAPVLLALSGLAPWVVPLLYSEAFSPSVDVLRWVLLGDLLKLLGWPMGFVILAAGQGRVLVVTQLAAVGMLVGAAWLLLPHLGVNATGLAALAMYTLHLPLVWFFGGRRLGRVWSRLVWGVAATTLFGMGLIHGLAPSSPRASAAIGVTLSGVLAWIALRRLGGKSAWPVRPWPLAAP